MKTHVVIADLAGIVVLSGCAAGGMSNERRASSTQLSTAIECELYSERYGMRMSPLAMRWNVRRYLPAHLTCEGPSGGVLSEYIRTSGGEGDVDFWLADMRQRPRGGWH